MKHRRSPDDVGSVKFESQIANTYTRLQLCPLSLKERFLDTLGIMVTHGLEGNGKEILHRYDEQWLKVGGCKVQRQWRGLNMADG